MLTEGPNSERSESEEIVHGDQGERIKEMEKENGKAGKEKEEKRDVLLMFDDT